MHWKLKVKGYGKIKSAEIEIAPLTLFVGDNNSGKSYLLSLLWGIKNLGIQVLLGKKSRPHTKSDRVLFEWLQKQINTTVEQGAHTVQIGSMAKVFQSVLQEKMNETKEDIVKRIFNSDDVKIVDLQIEFIGLENFLLNLDLDENQIVWISEGDSDRFGIRASTDPDGLPQINETHYPRLIQAIFSLFLCVEPNAVSILNRDVYLPAAKTGFMLTKDVINKVSRKKTFDIDVEQDEISPFTRPINQFLDVINELSFEEEGSEKFEQVVQYLEQGMTDGTVEMSTLPNREISYLPSGKEKGMPLRIVSAVVTELSPLILVLKHKKNLHSLFYEEPEMCLHPKLQQKMGKVICRLVNAPLHLIITTHSDIILQHINNMICLSGRSDVEEICSQYHYTKQDLLSWDDVKVYQFKSESGQDTEVEEIICGENGFAIPSLNDALDHILDESYTIQG